jgi:aconitase A
MGTIVPAISGPKRPQDYIALDRRMPNIKGQRLHRRDSQEIRWEGEPPKPEGPATMGTTSAAVDRGRDYRCMTARS